MGSRPRVLPALLALALSVFLFAPSGASAVDTGKIEGEVVAAGTTDGIEGVEVCAIDPATFAFVACEDTGPGGEYLLGNLADGSYLVEFWGSALGYVTQYFDGKALLSEATEVVISAGGTAANVDAEMVEGSEIEGTVTDAATGAGIEKVEVCAYGETASGGCAYTDASGDYTIRGLATDAYLVEFWAGLFGYETRYYDEKSSPATATPISVVAPDATAGVDARLSKLPSPAVAPPPLVTAPPIGKPRPKPRRCRKGFKRVKRHGRKVCVKKHRKKHHTKQHKKPR